jgi:hypothetical protein
VLLGSARTGVANENIGTTAKRMVAKAEKKSLEEVPQAGEIVLCCSPVLFCIGARLPPRHSPKGITTPAEYPLN